MSTATSELVTAATCTPIIEEYNPPAAEPPSNAAANLTPLNQLLSDLACVPMLEYPLTRQRAAYQRVKSMTAEQHAEHKRAQSRRYYWKQRAKTLEARRSLRAEKERKVREREDAELADMTKAAALPRRIPAHVVHQIALMLRAANGQRQPDTSADIDP